MSAGRISSGASFLDGGGELGALMRAYDWTRTPVLGGILTHLGAEVRVANGGTEALHAFRDFDPALVLLDIGMPEWTAMKWPAACELRFPIGAPHWSR